MQQTAVTNVEKRGKVALPQGQGQLHIELGKGRAQGRQKCFPGQLGQEVPQVWKEEDAGRATRRDVDIPLDTLL